MGKVILFVLAVIVIGAAVIFWPGGSSSGAQRATVKVERGTLTRHAVAVGRVEAEREVAVKSLSGGILTKVFVKLGQKVKAGEDLAEVRPVITNMDHIQAERALVQAKRGEESAREYLAGEHPAARLMRWFQGDPNLQHMDENAKNAREQAEERLKFLRQGKVLIEGREVDYIIRAPVDGHVVDLPVRVGTPVVPSSSYGSGTVLLTLADLDKPVFRGTVDEIDVGRMRKQMRARIKIGALPSLKVEATVTEIGLRARRQNNAVVFDVRLDLDPIEGEDTTIRSGFSAVAEVVVAKRENVLLLPERVVRFDGGKASVLVDDGSVKGHERVIEVGLSDGLRVEVLSGVDEGTTVFER